MLDGERIGSGGRCGGRAAVVLGAFKSPICYQKDVLVVIVVGRRGPDVASVLPPGPCRRPAHLLDALPPSQPFLTPYNIPPSRS